MRKSFDKQGHRGCRGLRPENTIAAMLHAVELGVSTLEMDAVITADNQVILSHEPFFNHLITTKWDGTFLTEATAKEKNIFKMSYAELTRFDVGLKGHPAFPHQQKLAATKPLLAHVIDVVENFVTQAKLAPVYYNIETKSTPETDGVFHPAPEIFVDLLLQIVFEKQVASRVVIQSFDVRTLQIVHRKYPTIQTSLLIEENDSRTIERQIHHLGFTPQIYSPHYGLVTKKSIELCHQMEMRVLPWTVNTAAEIAGLKTLGVDGVITDYPNLFAQVD